MALKTTQTSEGAGSVLCGVRARAGRQAGFVQGVRKTEAAFGEGAQPEPALGSRRTGAGQLPPNPHGGAPAHTLGPKRLLCVQNAVYKADLTIQGEKNLVVFKNGKPKAIKKESGENPSNALDFIRSVSHTDKREVTRGCSRYFSRGTAYMPVERKL